VLDSGVTLPDDVPALVTGVEALGTVTAVYGDQLCGQIPAVIETADYQANLHVASVCTTSEGTGGDVFGSQIQLRRYQPIPTDNKWCMFLLRLPSALDIAAASALETALQGVAGITTAKVLLYDSTSAEQSGAGNIEFSSHVRLEPT